MYIVKCMYWKRNPDTFEPDYNKTYREEVTADRLKDAILKYHTADGLNHDLCKYTQRQIYDVINTEE